MRTSADAAGTLYRDAGHDVQTVLQESLSGATDRQIHDVCRRERRCLVTLDLDFADVTRFAPEKTDGIIVLRPGKNPSLLTLELLIGRCLAALADPLLKAVFGLWRWGRFAFISVWTRHKPHRPDCPALSPNRRSTVGRCWRYWRRDEAFHIARRETSGGRKIGTEMAGIAPFLCRLVCGLLVL